MSYRDHTLADLQDNLNDALDYYRSETGEHDVSDYGYQSEGFEEAERIFALPYGDREDAIDQIGQSGQAGDYVKHHAAAYRLAWLESGEWRMSA